MALCPAGHQSQTTDYCDTCGAVMGGAPVTPAAAAASGSAGAAPAGAGSAGSATAASSAGGSGQGGGGTCPQCGAERGGRFCEECGFDYEMAELVPPPVQAAGTPPSAGPAAAAGPAPNHRDPLAETAAMPPDYDFEAEFAKAEREYAAEGTSSSPDVEPEPSASAAAAATTELYVEPGVAEAPAEASVAEPPAAAAPRQLAALVIADPEYYAAQVERGDIVEQEFPFPKYPGERRFALDADLFRIGRASASRGIAVEIDLTGPPLDPAVSHLHAQLLRAPDGSWVVVDLNSANGTRLNGAAEPLPAETEVPVKAGDRIHVGVWTTLILEEV